MSDSFNTDGIFTNQQMSGPITTNALESIECAIAFDSRDWSEDRRSQWIYFIVFGIKDKLDEESWNESANKFRWDAEDRKRVDALHEQWIQAKRFLQSKGFE